MTRLIPLLGLAFTIWMLYDCHKRRAAHWWIWIILFLPFGALAYFIIVKAPTLQVKPLIRTAPSVDQILKEYELSPSARNRLRLATALSDQGAHEDAIGHYSALLQQDPEDREALFGKAVSCQKSGDLNETIRLCHQLNQLQRSYRDYAVWTLLAETYWLADNRPQSLSTLEELNRINPRIEHQVILARCYLQMNEPDKARTLLTQAIQEYEVSPPHVQKTHRKFFAEAKTIVQRLK
jgi:hypothetical protein